MRWNKSELIHLNSVNIAKLCEHALVDGNFFCLKGYLLQPLLLWVIKQGCKIYKILGMNIIMGMEKLGRVLTFARKYCFQLQHKDSVRCKLEFNPLVRGVH